MTRERTKTVSYLLLIFIVCFLAYSNCFHNGFYQDDKFLITERAPQMQGRPLAAHFRSLYPDMSHFRPLGSLVISLLYHFFHEGVGGYHLFNLSLFYLQALLLFALIRSIAGKNPVPGFAAALLFVAHPLNTVFINSISTQIFVLLSVFLLTGLLFLQRPETGTPNDWLYYALSLVCFGLALLCHPSAFVFVPVVLLFFYLVRRKSFPISLALTVPFGLVMALYYLFQTKMTMMHIRFLGNYRMLHLSPMEFIAANGELFRWYVSKLFWPVDVTFIMNINPVTGPVLPKVLMMGLSLGVVAGLTALVWKKGNRSFALLWFLSGFVIAVPATAIYPFLGPSLEILWLVFPSIGGFMLAGLFFDRLTRRPVARPFAWTVLALIVLLMTWKTHADNRLWVTQENYDEYLSTVHPTNVVALRGLAYFYQLEGEYDKSLEYYQRIARLNTGYRPADVFATIAWYYEQRHDFENASFNYFKAIQSNDSCRSCTESREGDYERLINAFFIQDVSPGMERQLLESLHNHPGLDVPLINLGYFYTVAGQPSQAVPYFEQALGLTRDRVTRLIILSKLTALYYRLGLYDSAANAAEETLRDPDRPKVIGMLRNGFVRAGISPDAPDVSRFMSKILSKN